MRDMTGACTEVMLTIAAQGPWRQVLPPRISINNGLGVTLCFNKLDAS